MKTPHEHAVALGYYHGGNSLMPQNEAFYDWQHAVADHLYGWSRHAYHYQDDADRFRLSREDYQLALMAAADYPNTPPYEPAITEFAPGQGAEG